MRKNAKFISKMSANNSTISVQVNQNLAKNLRVELWKDSKQEERKVERV